MEYFGNMLRCYSFEHKKMFYANNENVFIIDEFGNIEYISNATHTNNIGKIQVLKYTSYKDKNLTPIYEADVLEIKNSPELMSTGFSNSKVGLFMCENNCDLEVHINMHKGFWIDYTMYFKRDGNYLKYSDIFPSEETHSDSDVFYTESSGYKDFLNYISGKCEVIGNIFEDKELNIFYGETIFGN